MVSDYGFYLSLCSQGVLTESLLQKKIGNGMDTKLWKDILVGEQRLLNIFPILYDLVLNKMFGC